MKPSVPQRILLLQGHPDPGAAHLCHALAGAYADGARDAGHEVRTVAIAELEFPVLRSKAAWETGEVPPQLAPAQEAIAWARHIVVVFPLWLGGMPALLKAFLEQVARPGFALGRHEAHKMAPKLLKGRSARLVVTMGMPALAYRWYYRAHGLKALERNILGFVGIAPVRQTLVGRVEGLDAAARGAWLDRLHALGRQAA